MEYTDKELIELLQKLSKELNKPSISAADCSNTPGYPNVSTYQTRFGSWSKAKEAAGLLSNNKFRQKTDQELIESLQAFYTKHGRAPKQKECRASNGLFGPNTYKDRFGGWEKALDAAGLKKNEIRSTQETDSYLLQSLYKFYSENGRAPRHEDCNNLKEYSYLKAHMVYVRRFGSFTEALELAKIPINSTGSAKEKDLREYIESIYSGPVLYNNRSLLGDLELDIYLPEEQLAIEFDGLYWHSDLFKHKNYHIDKTNRCSEANTRLIHVFESEWDLKQEIVKSRLLNLLNKSKKIYARHCKIIEVSSKEASRFLEQNHIQGNVNGSIRLGLSYKGRLVSLQTYCKSRYTKDCEWELLRFCNELGHVVVGGASKLFKYFLSKVSTSTTIVSYCDLRWNTGNLYKTLGFTESHVSAPNYWYFKNSVAIHHRQKFQKHKLRELLDIFDPSLSEVENMRTNNYKRIFDCGNIVFKYSSGF